MKYVVARLPFVAALLAASAGAALAAPVTYTFSGVLDGREPILQGQTINGSITFDTTQFTGFAGLDGLRQGYTNWGVDGNPPQLTGSIQFSLSGGLNVEVPEGSLTVAQMYVIKDEATDRAQFIAEVNGDTTDGKSVFFELTSGGDFSAARSIFPGAAISDFSFDQPVAFNAPGTFNIGYFNLSTKQGGVPIYTPNINLESVLITPATSVPEPGALMLTLLGFGCLGVLGRRRHSLVSPLRPQPA
ncbi:MAG: PEP-CTERM sorting domain-containing protein [Aquabacterium sp.]